MRAPARMRLAPIAALLLAGCVAAHGTEDAAVAAPDAALPDAGPGDAGPPPPRPRDLDLLVAMDGSNSVGEEQASFTRSLPRLLTALATGDVDGDGTPDAEPFASIQIGVVTSDMGTGGYTVPTCTSSDFGEDGVLRTSGRPDIPGCMATYPTFLRWGAGEDVAATALDVACVATVGTGGCGYEQPLEGMLKAISPAAPTAWTADGYRPPVFFRDTSGHGDGVNEGFVRAGSLLAVVMMTDEDDCSAADPGIYEPGSERFSGIDLSRRCDLDDQLHPTDRYVEGLLQLRRHPSQLAFFPIAGIPPDLEWAPGERLRWDLYVGDETQRDPRLIPTVDPEQPTRDMPSCSVAGRGLAFAPTRILEVAHGLDGLGARVGLASVCRESFESSFEAFAYLLLAE